jgi:hypothetical protein
VGVVADVLGLLADFLAEALEAARPGPIEVEGVEELGEAVGNVVQGSGSAALDGVGVGERIVRRVAVEAGPQAVDLGSEVLDLLERVGGRLREDISWLARAVAAGISAEPRDIRAEVVGQLVRS